MAATADQSAFLADLLSAGLLVDTGVPGIYGRGQVFEEVREAFDALVTRTGAAVQDAEIMRFPAVLPRRHLEDIGYFGSFPHLAGTVFSFTGDEAQAAEQSERAGRHEDWSEFQSMTDLALVPAPCYPVYPAVAARGPLPEGGVTIDAGAAPVFRHEPSGDPARMQSFHTREMVRIGEPDAVLAWREGWRDRARDLLAGLGLDARSDIATDPFFGRAGRMLAAGQREQELKFEVHVPIAGSEPTAVASFNYHQDHFGVAHDMRLADGSVAHSACLGFGHERTVLALLRRHGLDPDAWPAEVCRELWG